MACLSVPRVGLGGRLPPTPKGLGDDACAPSRWMPRVVQTWEKILMCLALWWTCAVAATLSMKSIVMSPHSEDHDAAPFPFPFAFTAMTNLMTGLLSRAAEAVQRRRCTSEAAREAPLQRADHIRLLALGLIQGIEIGCSNKALEFLAVAKRTMVNSLSTLFVMAVAVPSGLETLTWGKVAAALLLTLGGILQAVSTWSQFRQNTHSPTGPVEHDDNWDLTTGLTLSLSSMILASTRWACSQYFLQRSSQDTGLSGITKLRLVSSVMPVTAMVCTAMALVFEPDSLNHYSWAVFLRACGVAAVVMGLITSELWFVQLASAVALNVAGALHNIPIVLAGVILYHEKVRPLAAIGFGLCLFGATLYTMERRKRRAPRLPPTPACSVSVGQSAEELRHLSAEGEVSPCGREADDCQSPLVIRRPTFNSEREAAPGDAKVQPVMYGHGAFGAPAEP